MATSARTSDNEGHCVTESSAVKFGSSGEFSTVSYRRYHSKLSMTVIDHNTAVEKLTLSQFCVSGTGL